MKTTQEVFDIVSTHLLQQRRQARAGVDQEGLGYGVCVYRTALGLKCAVGCLIDEQQYKPIMEQAGSLVNFDSMKLEDYKGYNDSLRNQGAEAVLSALIANDIDIADPAVYTMLNRLQSVHDNAQPDRWHADLQGIAWDYHLKFNHAEK